MRDAGVGFSYFCTETRVSVVNGQTRIQSNRSVVHYDELNTSFMSEVMTLGKKEVKWLQGFIVKSG